MAFLADVQTFPQHPLKTSVCQDFPHIGNGIVMASIQAEKFIFCQRHPQLCPKKLHPIRLLYLYRLGSHRFNGLRLRHNNRHRHDPVKRNGMALNGLLPVLYGQHDRRHGFLLGLGNGRSHFKLLPCLTHELSILLIALLAETFIFTGCLTAKFLILLPESLVLLSIHSQNSH